MDPFEIPTNLSELTPEQIDAAVERANAEAADLRGTSPADVTDDQITRLRALADFLDTVDAHVEAQHEAEQARQAELDSLGSRFDARDGDEGTEGGDEPTEGEPNEGDPVEGDEPAESLAAAASGSRIRRRGAPRRPVLPARREAGTGRLSLVAAADVGGGVSAGNEFGSLDALTAAFIRRVEAFPRTKNPSKGQYSKLNVALLRRDFSADPDGLYDENPDYQGQGGGMELLLAASRESRLRDGSLVASGGWCAPSTTMYDFPADETLDGIIDLPEVGITRGGIRFTLGPNFADIFAGAGFRQTEAQAMAGEVKNCTEVSCPDFEDIRLEAHGYCVKAPLLTLAAYPEVVKRFLAGTIVAEQHKVAAALIASMRLLLPNAVTLSPVRSGGTVWSGLTALELAAEGIRQQWRLPEGQSMEVKAPRWYKIALRADLANRMGIAAMSVTDEQLMQHFADRKLMVQFVLNYQELDVSAGKPIDFTHGSVGGPANTVEVMIYPAGTFVKGTQDVINLDTVYDTADLQTNVYTAAFVEDGVLLAKMKYGGYRLNLPIFSSGQLGAANLDAAYGTAAAEAA